MESLALLVLQTELTRWILNFPGTQSSTRNFAYLGARLTHDIQLAPPLDNLARIAQLLDRRADSHAASKSVSVVAVIKLHGRHSNCRPVFVQANQGFVARHQNVAVVKMLREHVGKPVGRPMLRRNVGLMKAHERTETDLARWLECIRDLEA